MQRLYDNIVTQHLQTDEEMIFLSGPRQVGKTTTSQQLSSIFSYHYFNWDNEDHRQIIMQGPAKIIEAINLNQMREKRIVVGFDEIHKRPDWKNFLKGFYDSYKNDLRIIVTGSARLDIYKKGDDSLMGRYFQYRMHPISVAEILRNTIPTTEIEMPKKINDDDFNTLYEFGGYPKPYLKKSKTFSHRWQQLRKQQLINEDIRDVSMIHDLQSLTLLIEILQRQASCALTYSNLATQLRVSVDTIRRWIEILESFYFCYLIKPWSKNIARALTKEPKVYLWDWSMIKDAGAKAENFIASHLLKACHCWTDLGLGDYGLYYIRDLEKREVDFVVTKNDEPWFLIEVKNGNKQRINPNLQRFQQMTQAKHAFQVVLNADFISKNCFDYTDPVIVPAKTLLSQLI